jgi:sulfatase modifying factor 1
MTNRSTRQRARRKLSPIWLLTLLALYAGHGLATEPALPTEENSLGMRLVLIPAGDFVMGSPETENHREPYETDEIPREVRISRAYWIGAHEVTRGQFRQFVEATEYRTECQRDGLGGYGVDPDTGALSGREAKFDWQYVGFDQSDEHPVVNVTWNDAVEFCAWLSRVEGSNYRLPTEAEYACRARTTTANVAGDDPEALAQVGNTADARCRARYPDRETISADDGHLYTAPVGSYRANAWGLYDMHGNVWEWTADRYGPALPGPLVDPRGPETGIDRCIKGGDWYHGPAFGRSAMRFPIPPNLPRRHGGFRVVREAI